MLDEARLPKVVMDQTVMPKQRRLYFSGVKNFRDLGGYKTKDERSVRWGLLYRSDGLHKLTDADLPRFLSLDLDRVIDFRSDYEREMEPDRLPGDANIRLVDIPILDASTALVRESREELTRKLKNIDPVEYMTQSYVGFVRKFTPEFGRFFCELSAANGQPILFHCTAGKDRTGFAAALILRMLGVRHETVMQDYLLTNDYFFAGYRWNLIMARVMKGKRFTDAIKGFMLADPRYLLVAFETIECEYGSFQNYLRSGLGLSDADIESFKALYLE